MIMIIAMAKKDVALRIFCSKSYFYGEHWVIILKTIELRSAGKKFDSILLRIDYLVAKLQNMLGVDIHC